MGDPVLNAVECPACGARARVTSNKSGGYTVHCPECKFQGFAKTPKAAEAMRARFGASDQPAEPSSKGEGEDWLSKL